MKRAPIPRHAAAGFTLIELLVVVLIIGIVMSFVSLSLDPTGPADRLATEAARLQALTSAATDDAVLYGRQIGLDITPRGYRFLRFGETGWQPITTTDSPLRPRTLDAGLQLALISTRPDGKKGPPLFQQNRNDRPSDDDSGDGGKPQNTLRPDAVFLSSGEIVPFTLELSATGVAQRFDLTGQGNGTVAMKKIGRTR